MRSILVLLAWIPLAVADTAAAAGLPPVRASLVKDLDQTPAGYGSDPQYFRTLGDRVYFAASSLEKGAEIYSTDAAGNLRQHGDIAVGPEDSWPEPIARVGDRVIVAADDRVTGRQLWSLPVSGEGVPLRLTAFGNWSSPSPATVKAVAELPGRTILHMDLPGYRLWSSDGTATGTFPLSLQSGLSFDVMPAACTLGGAAIVSGTAQPQPVLARTDGLPGGGSVLATLPFSSISSATKAVAVGPYCYFLFSLSEFPGGWRLWRSDGTSAGTVEIASASEGTVAALVGFGADACFTDVTRDARTRLHCLRGVGGAVEMVAELPGPDAGGWLVAHRGRLIFNAYYPDGSSFVSALFISDGTAAGTRHLHSLGPYQTLNQLSPFLVGDALVLESFMNNDTRIDLIDGSAEWLQSSTFLYAGSALLGDDRRIGRGTTPGGSTREVWMSDGSGAGTRPLHEIRPETGNGIGEIYGQVAIGDTLLFSGAFDSAFGPWRNTLARTDGTVEGTRVLSTAPFSEQLPWRLAAYGATGIAFMADYRVYTADSDLQSVIAMTNTPVAYWLQSYGHGRGVIHGGCNYAHMLCGIDSETGASYLLNTESFESGQPIGEVAGVAIFQRGNEIWRSDGTAVGTFRVLEGRYLSDAPDSPFDAVLDGRLYFVSCAQVFSCDLTVTDGSVAGTRLLRPVAPGQLRASGRVGNLLVFGTSGQIWSTDGTAAGTVLLLNSDVSAFALAGNQLHFYATCAACKQHYAVTDGTPAGTRPVSLPGAMLATPGLIAALDDETVVFSCQSARRGEELCQTDADGSATVALPEIYPGSGSAEPRFVGRTPSAVYFSAVDGRHGRELWQLRRLPDAIFGDGFD